MVSSPDVGLPSNILRRKPQEQMDHGGVARHGYQRDVLGPHAVLGKQFADQLVEVADHGLAQGVPIGLGLRSINDAPYHVGAVADLGVVLRRLAESLSVLQIHEMTAYRGRAHIRCDTHVGPGRVPGFDVDDLRQGPAVAGDGGDLPVRLPEHVRKPPHHLQPHLKRLVGNLPRQGLLDALKVRDVVVQRRGRQLEIGLAHKGRQAGVTYELVQVGEIGDLTLGELESCGEARLGRNLDEHVRLDPRLAGKDVALLDLRVSKAVGRTSRDGALADDHPAAPADSVPPAQTVYEYACLVRSRKYRGARRHPHGYVVRSE